jgi:diguanylate cyclase (GGDEF)-like protein
MNAIAIREARSSLHVVPPLERMVRDAPLAVAYQPIVDVRSGEVFGYEALGRTRGASAWPNGLGELPGPGALLDAAHAAGCLLTLDRRWRMLAIEGFREAPASTRCFLNVDPRVAEDPLFAPGFTARRIVDAHLEPGRFVLELTEREGLQQDAIERVLAHYAEQGFAIALDDVGTRGQSLERVLRLRPSIVKLDAALVRGIARDGARRHVVRSFVELGERTGALVCAEGIETSADLESVVAQGVHLVQGFAIGRPQPRPAPIEPSAREVLCRPRSSVPRTPSVENAVIALAESLRVAPSIERALDEVVHTTARVLGTSGASVRLLDDRREGLVVAARAGASIHDTSTTFVIGEGLVGWVALHERPLRVGSAADDPRFSPKSGMHAPFGSFVGVPLRDERGCYGVLATTSPDRDAFDAHDEQRLALIAALSAPMLAVHRLRRLAETDPLTRLLNRHALEHALPTDPSTSVSVLLLDVDHFKRVNDVFGHAVGDAVLVDVAREISGAVRTDDRVLRLGGEEFLVVLPGAALASAGETAERIRARVADSVHAGGAPIRVSVGVAERREGERREALLARADAALYTAKTLGRDRVCLTTDA